MINRKSGVQVLGSGGPLNPEGRASTSYLVWWNDSPKIIVDLGAGSMTNFARAQHNPSHLAAILISHLHPDHVSELPSFCWDAQVLDRKAPLTLIGPSGNEFFPDMQTFARAIFGEAGIFPIMKNPGFPIEVKVIDAQMQVSNSVFRLDDVEVSAYPVPHGKAPCLAYRVDAPSFKIVFAGDQTGLDPGFISFAQDTDLLVLHTALSPFAEHHPFAKVIGMPKDLAKIAESAGARRVLLSHLMGFPPEHPDAFCFALSNMDALVKSVREVYSGSISIASDLAFIAL